MIYALIGIGVVVFIIYKIIWHYIHAERQPRCIVKLYTGPLGAGKTGLSSINLIRDYKRLYKRWKKASPKKQAKMKKPVIYSNIPYQINKKEYAKVLKREHLLLLEPFPEDELPLVLWDEVGLSCNQYSYDDPNIISENIIDNYRCVEVFIRFFRHFYDDGNDSCRLYLTDQAAGDICITLRRRLGYVDNLKEFHRYLGILPFYKVYVNKIEMSEDSVSNVNHLQYGKDVKDRFYFGYLPYKWMTVKHYDSLCYSGIKDHGVVDKLDFYNWADNPEGLKTRYVPDLRMKVGEMAVYKNRRKQEEKRAILADSGNASGW